MRFIAEDNPNLYIDVENYSELEKRIKDFGNPNYNYEIILEVHELTHTPKLFFRCLTHFYKIK